MAPVEPAPVPPAPDEPVKHTTVSRAVLRVVAKIWLAILIVGSLQPARPGVVSGLHRGIHWLAFAGAALLLFSLSRTRRQEILGAFTIFLLGFSLELLQHLIYRTIWSGVMSRTTASPSSWPSRSTVWWAHGSPGPARGPSGVRSNPLLETHRPNLESFNHRLHRTCPVTLQRASAYEGEKRRVALPAVAQRAVPLCQTGFVLAAHEQNLGGTP